MTNIVTFKDDKLELEVNISPEEDTVWLSLDQLSNLFNKNKSTISRGRLQVQVEQNLSSNYISGIHLIKKSVEQFIRSVVA